ncbi:MAG TPA: DNA starvation/stationary phase protection protein [Bacillales bacterium]|nr:DNA starvation/stationary phase protection protein [Bacillales bacterium]
MQENQRLINFLNQQVSNFAVLYVKLHRYHWFVQGFHFFELHKKFEEMYEEAAEWYDELAERILAIGGKPLATMTKYLDEKTLAEAEADNEIVEMLSVLHSDFRQMAGEMREGRAICEQFGDEPTADLLVQIEKTLDKHAWMVRSAAAKALT